MGNSTERCVPWEASGEGLVEKLGRSKVATLQLRQLLLPVLMAMPLVLSGCLPINHLQAPVALRYDRAGLAIAVCDDISVSHIQAAIWHGADDVDVFWEADGDATPLFKGEPLTTGSLDSRFEDVVVALEPEISGQTRIEIILTLVGSEEGSEVAAFDITNAHSSEWAHPDGSVTSQPCTE